MAGIKHPSTSRKNVIIGQMGGGVLSIQAIQVELDLKFLEMDKILTSNYTQKQCTCIRIHDIEFRLYFHFVDNRQ